MLSGFFSRDREAGQRNKKINGGKYNRKVCIKGQRLQNTWEGESFSFVVIH